MTSVFAGFEANLVSFFHTAEADVIKFASAFAVDAEKVLEIAFEDLASIAGQAVLQEASKVISGTEKFGNAVANVVQSVEASGRTVALQSAQAAVQLAYLEAQKIATAGSK